jgi:hypothetical protein
MIIPETQNTFEVLTNISYFGTTVASISLPTHYSSPVKSIGVLRSFLFDDSDDRSRDSDDESIDEDPEDDTQNNNHHTTTNNNNTNIIEEAAVGETKYRDSLEYFIDGSSTTPHDSPSGDVRKSSMSYGALYQYRPSAFELSPFGGKRREFSVDFRRFLFALLSYSLFFPRLI